jgi:hypothetical protein
MNTAIIVGRGPEADVLIERHLSLPKNLLLFRPDFSVSRNKERLLPSLALTRPGSAKKALSANEVSRIAMIGALRFDNPDLRRGPFYRHLVAQLGAPGNNSDILKRCIHEKFRGDFKFPSVRTALPFLFLNEDFCVNPEPFILKRALRESFPPAGCTIVNVAGEATKVFRIARGNGTNLFHFCLTPTELRNLHQQKSIKRFFFNRKQTIIIDREEMAAYARKHDLTLQSFV